MEGMVRAPGVVFTFEDGQVVVRAPAEGTDGCAAACDACGLCDKRKMRYIDIIVPYDRETGTLNRWDKVEVEYERRDPGYAALLFFLPPLFGLVGGGYLLRYLAGGGDMVFLIGALAGIVIGGLISVMISRRFPNMVRPEGRILTPKAIGESS